MSVLLALFAALQYGVADFLGGAASKRNSVFVVIVLSQFFGLLFGSVAAVLFGARNVELRDLAWGIASGIGGAAGLGSLYYALAHTVVSVASPAAALVGAGVPLLFGIVTGERLVLTGWIGIALILPAVFLLTGERAEDDSVPSSETAKALLFGSLAGIGFGVYFVCISRTSPSSGLAPLVAARSASLLLLLPLAIGQRASFHGKRETWKLVAATGILDMGANVALLAAMRSGLLVVVTTISSIYPAPTVLLAAVVFSERIPRRRWIGIALAICGVALMSAG